MLAAINGKTKLFLTNVSGEMRNLPPIASPRNVTERDGADLAYLAPSRRREMGASSSSNRHRG